MLAVSIASFSLSWRYQANALIEHESNPRCGLVVVNALFEQSAGVQQSGGSHLHFPSSFLQMSCRRALLKLTISYGLILLVIWTANPYQRILYITAVVVLAVILALSFESCDKLGLRRTNLLRSLWIAVAALLLAAVLILIAAHFHTLHAPHTVSGRIARFWGYALWPSSGRFSCRMSFLRRLLIITPSPRLAAFLARLIFALAHRPTPSSYPSPSSGLSSPACSPPLPQHHPARHRARRRRHHARDHHPLTAHPQHARLVVDHAGYPSGFAAGGFSSTSPNLRMQALEVTRQMNLLPDDFRGELGIPGLIALAAARSSPDLSGILRNAVVRSP
jgi:hypothetical protein